MQKTMKVTLDTYSVAKIVFKHPAREPPEPGDYIKNT